MNAYRFKKPLSAGTAMSPQIRLAALAALTLLLTACPTTMPSRQGQSSHTHNHIPAPYNPNLSAGTAVSRGTTLQPTGSSTTYRAVSFQELPQWNEQSFGESLAAFQKSCLKLANQAKWQYTCARANQTARNTAAAKAFFEQNFTPWQVSERGQASGKITGYYEPVLHGDTRNTSTARFPIYGIPSDFVSIPLPANLRNSKASVRVAPTGNNRGAIQSNGAYIANLAQFPITARTTALKGRFVGNQFVPYPRPNQRRRAERTRAHLGLRQRPCGTVFHAHPRLGQAAHARRQFCAPRLCR